MVEIANFQVEKQQGMQLCWAACTKAVLDHYGLGPPTQHELRQQFAGYDGEGVQKESGTAEKALKAFGALQYASQKFDGDENSERNIYNWLGMEISSNLRKNQPVIAVVWGLGPNNTWHHELIIFRDNEQPEHLLGMKDPADPPRVHRVELKSLMKGAWEVYPEVPGFHGFARRFFFTKRPAQSYRLAEGRIV